MPGERQQTRNSYYDHTMNARVVKIVAGEYHMTGDDVMISTLLGSCVAVCLHDRETGIGGMNHFMLPCGVGSHHPESGASARYGVHAMELLIERFLQMGGKLANLEAKVFGAGKVMHGMTDVGNQNLSFALRYLKSRRIRVVAMDVGDIYPRKVLFSPATGRAFVKRLRKNHSEGDLGGSDR